jgi:hypothetical protein
MQTKKKIWTELRIPAANKWRGIDEVQDPWSIPYRRTIAKISGERSIQRYWSVNIEPMIWIRVGESLLPP